MIKFSTYRPAYDMGKWYDSQRAPEKEPTEADGVLFWEWDIKVSHWLPLLDSEV